MAIVSNARKIIDLQINNRRSIKDIKGAKELAEKGVQAGFLDREPVVEEI
jgi:hypothetical protein